jgi:hypothetical protein
MGDHGRADRRTIVIIDDHPDILDAYRAILTEHFQQRYFYHFFDNSNEALDFVNKNSQGIIGFIQDISRTDDVSKRDGVSFFNNVIDNLTPWAKCLFVSASIQPTDVLALSRELDHRLRWFNKYDFRSKESIRPHLDWLVTPIGDEHAAALDRDTSVIATSLAPAWEELCRYIVRHPEHLHTMSPAQFELLAGEIFRSSGWDVEFTARTRDGGYDIIAVRRIMPTILRVLVEAKRFSPRRPVGVDIVRSLFGVKQSKAASQLVLVTSSFVSLDAKKEFSRVVPWELDFFERDKILDWCRDRSMVRLLGEFDTR